METTTARDSIARNALFVFGGQLVTWTLTATSLAIVPRYLGAHDVGIVNIGATFGGLVAGLAGLGMGTVITRDIARDRSSAGATVATAAWLNLGLGTVGAVGAIVLALSLGYSGLILGAIVLSCVAVPLGMFGSVLGAAWQGLEVMRWNAFFDIATKSLLLVGLIFVVSLGLGIVQFIWVSLVVSVATFIGQLAISLVVFRFSLNRFSKALAIYLIKASMPFFLVGIFWMMYTSVDVLLLSQMSGPSSVGIYSTPMRLFGTALFVPVTITTVIFPRLAAAHSSDSGQMAKLADRTLRFTATVSVIMAFGAAGLSDERVTALLGHSYAGTVGPVILALSVSIVPTTLSIVGSRMAIAANRQVAMSWIGAGALVAKIILGIALIPLFDTWFENPALGAATGLVLTEAGMTGFMLRFLPAGTLTRGSSPFYARVGISASAALVAYILAHVATSPAAASIVACAVFAASVITLRAYTVSEILAAARLPLAKRNQPSAAVAQ